MRPNCVASKHCSFCCNHLSCRVVLFSIHPFLLACILWVTYPDLVLWQLIYWLAYSSAFEGCPVRFLGLGCACWSLAALTLWPVGSGASSLRLAVTHATFLWSMFSCQSLSSSFGCGCAHGNCQDLAVCPPLGHPIFWPLCLFCPSLWVIMLGVFPSVSSRLTRQIIALPLWCAFGSLLMTHTVGVVLSCCCVARLTTILWLVSGGLYLKPGCLLIAFYPCFVVFLGVALAVLIWLHFVLLVVHWYTLDYVSRIVRANVL